MSSTRICCSDGIGKANYANRCVLWKTWPIDTDAKSGLLLYTVVSGKPVDGLMLLSVNMVYCSTISRSSIHQRLRIRDRFRAMTYSIF